MAWIETSSLSFTARHEAAQSDAALAVLDDLERYRTHLEGIFPSLPENVSVVLHDSFLQLGLAQPYLPLARRIASPAGRRYMAGWFTAHEVHTLSPELLRRLAGGDDSLRALLLTPLRAYTLLVVGVNNPLLPPPFRPSTFARYWRIAWMAEGAAQFFSGQLPHLRAAIARRLRGKPPPMPPSSRDAALLGGSIFDLLAQEQDIAACVRLACRPSGAGSKAMLESAFGRQLEPLRERWRAHLEELARAEPSVQLDDVAAVQRDDQ
jgi:hypothetical protein